MSLFAEIQEQIGVEVASFLRSQFGGKTIRIPQSVHALNPLYPLGRKAEELAYFYGGLLVWIPTGKREELAKRDSQIEADFESGVSIDDLALSYSMSRRNVFKCIKRGKRNAT